MFLMCPLTLTSPSLYLLLIGHPWWLSHLVLKTVGCILSAQGPLGGYSSSSSLVLGGQGQSLCLSPCPSTLHSSLEVLLHLPRESEAHLQCWAGMRNFGHRDACQFNEERVMFSSITCISCRFHMCELQWTTRADVLQLKRNMFKWTKHKKIKKTSILGDVPQMHEGAANTHNTTHYREAPQIQKKTAEVFPEDTSAENGIWHTHEVIEVVEVLVTVTFHACAE